VRKHQSLTHNHQLHVYCDNHDIVSGSSDFHKSNLFSDFYPKIIGKTVNYCNLMITAILTNQLYVFWNDNFISNII